MNIFAYPLFKAVSDVLPSMTFAVSQMDANRETWKEKVLHQNMQREEEQEEAKKLSTVPDRLLSTASGSTSSPSSKLDLAYSESLPTSHSSSQRPLSLEPSVAVGGQEPRRASASSIQSETSGSRSRAQVQDPQKPSSGQHPNHVRGPTRRPGNTSPSQTQFNSAPDPRIRGSISGSASENVPPERRESIDTLSQSNMSAVTSDAGSRNVSVTGGGGSITHRNSKGSKSSEGDPHLQFQQRSTPYSMNHASARHSPYSVHERHSSGGHTTRSQSVPYSPTETQATSITDESDDKSSQVRERCQSPTLSKGMPGVVNVENPGSSRSRAHTDGSKGVDVKTSVVNGIGGIHSNSGSRLVNKKSSRFLNFWKKSRKAAESSP